MILKVFLVEDELYTRKGIRDNIPWDFLNLNYVGEAKNGEEALPLILELRPDIIISDIKMPRMDGIELSKKVKEFMPRVKIIFISAFDKFEFAQQAIEIGIAQYVLKPITPKTIISSLQKIKALIQTELLETTSVTRNKINTPIELPDYKEVFNSIKDEEFVATLLIDTENQEIQTKLSDLFENDQTFLLFKGSPFGGLCIGKTKEHCLEKAYQYADAIIQEFSKDALTLAIGNIEKGKLGACASCKQAQRALNHKHLLGINKIISYNELELITNKNKKLILLDSGSILEYIMTGEIENCLSFLQEVFKSPKSINLSMNNYLTYIAIDTLNKIYAFLSENIGNPEELIPELTYPDSLIEECSSVEKAVALFYPIVKTTLSLRKKVNTAYYDVIKKAKKEIERKYNDPLFSLVSISSFCNMSPAYFSTVFKQSVNESFIKYLTNLRIEKAKILLKTTSLRSSEISSEVGYNDAHYFSFTFKKNTGITPTEFRNS